MGIDIVGPLPSAQGGFTHILVMIDYATRYPEAVPLRNTHTRTLAKKMLRIFSGVGFPSKVITDQGTNFMNQVMQDLWAMLRVWPLRTSVYHPQTNGLVERFNQTLKMMLRHFTLEQPSQCP